MTDKPQYIPQPKAAWLPWDLVLVGFVALIAVVAAAVALRQLQHRRAIGRVVQELQGATLAFKEYMQRNESAPESSNFGEAPATPFLAQLKWGEPTSVGGYYYWLRGPAKESEPGLMTSGRIGIAAFPPAPAISLSSADLLAIDQKLDDGNLASGDFRLGFNGWPVLTLRAKP